MVFLLSSGNRPLTSSTPCSTLRHDGFFSRIAARRCSSLDAEFICLRGRWRCCWRRWRWRRCCRACGPTPRRLCAPCAAVGSCSSAVCGHAECTKHLPESQPAPRSYWQLSNWGACDLNNVHSLQRQPVLLLHVLPQRRGRGGARQSGRVCFALVAPHGGALVAHCRTLTSTAVKFVSCDRLPLFSKRARSGAGGGASAPAVSAGPAVRFAWSAPGAAGRWWRTAEQGGIT